MLNAQDQDPELVKKIRICASDMLEIAEILKESGSEHIKPLYETEQAIRRAAVQLFGFFPEPDLPEFKPPTFRLQLPRSSPKTHISTESLAAIGVYTQESL